MSEIPCALPACGASLAEHYRLLGNQLGAGTHGSIHEAECRSTGRRVAVKKYDKVALNDRERRRLQSEVSLLAALSHSGVVRFEAWYEEPEVIYVVLEKLAGGSFFSWLDENSDDSCPEAAVAEVAWQLLHALEHLHRQGIAHRDVKLENIMFDGKDRRRVKLVDFGFARRIVGNISDLQDRCGSLQYVAPEVTSGKSYNEGCDIFSLGSVLYALLTSEMLFYGEDKAEIRQKNSRGEVDWSARFFYLSAEAQEFVKWLLTVDPEQRPSATEALEHPWLKNSRWPEGACGDEKLGAHDDMDADDEAAKCSRDGQSMQAVCRALTRDFSTATQFARDVFVEVGTGMEDAVPWRQMQGLLGRCNAAKASWQAAVPQWADEFYRPFA